VLKSLREKAADRNEDEFYFGMMSRKGPGARIKVGKSFTGAVEGDRGNKAMDVDTVRLLKTQDLGYIRTMRNVATKEVRELEERWVLAGGTEMEDDEDDDESDDEMSTPASKPQNPKKIVFFDAADEREQALEKKAEDEDEAMGDSDKDDKKEAEARRKEQNLEKLERRLRSAKKKLKALKDAEYELELQQAKMAKTATSGGITKSGRRIKVRERKR
jgi:U3 small nucleolar RNA-associated protein 11